ncbi:MCE family protein [Streptomyces sp. CBMA152]|uniref:MCE family protein n=1 Tax=Streptomyces sp. CBMA152 TaxID=1896312 RepID=UPI0016602C01|nr:MCE family protein [Streptomyces sp. CBMA152]MBD0747795.1 ABC transporter substrate-binding protein [Streptomyces sp. CBMA152]
MITLGTHLKNLAFLLLGALVLGYIGVKYADLGRFVGAPGSYTVRVELAETGGLFTGSGVTYRGVDVGRVRSIGLTDDGVEARLAIKKGTAPIPADLEAKVAGLSAVGEQYIDLAPRTDKGPFLGDGSIVPRTRTSTPAPITRLLTGINDLAASVPTDELRTAVDELGRAFANQGSNLQVLLDTGSQFINAADQALPATTQLLVDGETVLRTQADSTKALTSFATGARKIARQLKDSDSDLRRVIEQTPEAADEFTSLLRDTDPGLSVLLANLTTTSELLVTRQHGLEELMVRLPRVAAAGSTAVGPGGAAFGMVTTFFKPLPCTAGYEGTVYRNGLDTSGSSAVNSAARCAAPPGSGQNVRGSGNAPRGSIPVPAVPGSGVSSGPVLGAPSAPSRSPVDLAGLLGLGG